MMELSKDTMTGTTSCAVLQGAEHHGAILLPQTAHMPQTAQHCTLRARRGRVVPSHRPGSNELGRMGLGRMGREAEEAKAEEAKVSKKVREMWWEGDKTQSHNAVHKECTRRPHGDRKETAWERCGTIRRELDGDGPTPPHSGEPETCRPC